jgi:hypothetical protein
MSMSVALLFLAAVTAQPIVAERPRMTARAQARATVRIVRGARLGWGDRRPRDGARLTRATFVDFRDNGAAALRRPAEFIEFE